jgi:hypothetical protein
MSKDKGPEQGFVHDAEECCADRKNLAELLDVGVDAVKHSRLADMQNYHFALTCLNRLDLKPVAESFLTAAAALSGFHPWHRQTALLPRARL